MPHAPGHEMSTEMQRAIKDAVDCASVCQESVRHCLQMGGKHAEASHIGLLLDCAEICQTNANFMLRNSDFHGRSSELCAEVCERCAQSCDQFGDDDQMRACAEACRRCAASCRQMSGMGRRAA